MDTEPSHDAGDQPQPRQPSAGPRYERDPHFTPSSYLTAQVPPIGGTIKSRPEDFLVEELPLYEPCGEGEHIYLFIEKRDLSTLQVAQILARHFGVKRSAIGYAGMKDKIALTRQLISVHVPGKRVEDFPSIRHDRISVLWADLHTNKLRVGHLKGNRFSVKIRNVDLSKAVHARDVINALEHEGVPNRIGEQRFGRAGNNHLIGRWYILGDYQAALDELLSPNDAYFGGHAEARRQYAKGDLKKAVQKMPRNAHAELAALRALERGASPEQAFHAIGETERKYYLSAMQSAVFNAVLDWRVAKRTIHQLQEGDLAYRHDSRGVFVITPELLADAGTQKRLSENRLSPSGPMWGTEMFRARGRTDEVELEALHAAGLTPDKLKAFAEREGKHLLDGTRRPLRVNLMYPEVDGGIDEHGSYVRCAFELPRGAFATVVLREIIKPARDRDLADSPPRPGDQSRSQAS